MTAELGAITEDAALGGRLRLKQPRRGHRFGHDAVLLAAATPAAAGEHVVEFGAGVGLAGLAVAARLPGVRVTLVERDPALVALAAENARANGLADRIRAIHLDVAAPARAFAAAGLPAGSAQRVMMNPPFNDPARTRPSPDDARAAAYAMGPGTLAAWCRAGARLLAGGGALTLIWRADGLQQALEVLARHFGGLAVIPIYPKAGVAAIRIVVGARKGSRAPLALFPGLILSGQDGRSTPEAEAILRGDGLLPGLAAMLLEPR